MKIHADKINDDPTHGLSMRDVKLIVSSVPSDWIIELTNVRLANSKCGPEAFFNRHDGQLIIYCRYGTKRQILVEILSVLAAPSLNIESTVSHSPSKAESRRLMQFIEPLVEKILPNLTPPNKLSPEAHIRWQPIPFSNDAA
jgi:hypothetical protein